MTMDSVFHTAEVSAQVGNVAVGTYQEERVVCLPPVL